jgi:hypothetical protein
MEGPYVLDAYDQDYLNVWDDNGASFPSSRVPAEKDMGRMGMAAPSPLDSSPFL